MWKSFLIVARRPYRKGQWSRLALLTLYSPQGVYTPKVGRVNNGRLLPGHLECHPLPRGANINAVFIRHLARFMNGISGSVIDVRMTSCGVSHISCSPTVFTARIEE